MSCFVRVRHPNGEELTIDLIELEEALEGGSPGHYYLLPNSGRIILISSEEMDEESVAAVGLDEEEGLPIDPIESGVQFRWMEEFIGTVHSIAARNALRKKWFQFEAMKVNTEAANLSWAGSVAGLRQTLVSDD